MVKELLLFLVFGLVTQTYAEDSKVIDLGEMSVNGEIRRPTVTWIDSQKPVKEALPIYFRSEFESFEARLLQPAPVPSSGPVVEKSSL